MCIFKLLLDKSNAQLWSGTTALAFNKILNNSLSLIFLNSIAAYCHYYNVWVSKQGKLEKKERNSCKLITLFSCSIQAVGGARCPCWSSSLCSAEILLPFEQVALKSEICNVLKYAHEFFPLPFV